MKNQNKIFIISGPSAVGKNTIIEGVKKIIPQLEETISCTARKKRPGEIDGKHYYFLDKTNFEEKIKNNEFLEYFEVHGKYYGTLKSEIKRIQKNNKFPLLIIDVQGALQVKKHQADAVLIFIKPDSWESLKERLKQRNTDPQELKMRLKNAKNELTQAKFYDYQITNYTGKIQESIKKTAEIIKKEGGVLPAKNKKIAKKY